MSTLEINKLESKSDDDYLYRSNSSDSESDTYSEDSYERYEYLEDKEKTEKEIKCNEIIKEMFPGLYSIFDLSIEDIDDTYNDIITDPKYNNKFSKTFICSKIPKQLLKYIIVAITSAIDDDFLTDTEIFQLYSIITEVFVNVSLGDYNIEYSNSHKTFFQIKGSKKLKIDLIDEIPPYKLHISYEEQYNVKEKFKILMYRDYSENERNKKGKLLDPISGEVLEEGESLLLRRKKYSDETLINIILGIVDGKEFFKEEEEIEGEHWNEEWTNGLNDDERDEVFNHFHDNESEFYIGRQSYSDMYESIANGNVDNYFLNIYETLVKEYWRDLDEYHNQTEFVTEVQSILIEKCREIILKNVVS